MSGRSHAPLIITVVVGAIGGIARYADDVENNRRRFRWHQALAAVGVAGFTGWLIAEIAAASGRGSWVYAAAGVAGWMGGNVVALLSAAVTARLETTARNAGEHEDPADPDPTPDLEGNTP